MVFIYYPGNQYNSYQQQNIIRVNGENGAKMYALAPNSSVIMLDEYEAAIWVKMTDGAGYPTLTKYRIEECKPEHATDFKSLEDRIKKLEEVIYESDHTENEHI